MSRNKEIWNTKENAEAYDVYAQNFPMYRDTSRDLVELTEIKPNMTVIDLASGTGVTTQAILDKTNGDVHLIAIDQSEEMQSVAKSKFNGENIKFIVSAAEDIDKIITEPVDAIVCNSAFWQMRARQVFKSASNLLKEGGCFAFNVPDSFFTHNDFKKQPNSLSSYTVGDLILWGKENKLSLVTRTIKSYSKSAEEVLAFNEIPVMKRNFKTEDEKNNFTSLTQQDQTNSVEAVREWVIFIFKKFSGNY